MSLNAGGEGSAELVSELDAAVAEDVLPETLRSLDAEARKRYVAEQAAQRASIKAEIGALAKERDAFIARELATREDAKDSFGSRLFDTVRRQAAEVGLEYEAEARH